MKHDREKVNKRVAFYRVNNNLEELKNNTRTFESIFNISFKKENYILFETINNVGSNKITYGEAKKNIIDYARYFSINIPSSNKYVGIYLENSPEWVYTFYGLLMSGYIPVLLSTRCSKNELQDVIKRLKIDFIVTDNSKEINFVNVINIFEIKHNKPFDKSYIATWSNEIVFMTSGVSDKAKLVTFTGKEISYQIENSLYLLKQNVSFASAYKGCLKHLVILPFYHIFGLIAVFLWFSFFNVTFVLPNNLNPGSIRQAALIGKTTHIFAVPLFWDTLAKQIIKVVKTKKAEKKFNNALKLSIKIQKRFPKVGPKFVRYILFKKYLNNIFGNSVSFCVSGGGNISKETLRTINGLGYPLSNGYGATEIGITSLENSTNILNRISSSTGYPFNSIDYHINEEDGIKILYVSGKSICNKIMNNNQWDIVDKTKGINTKDIIKKENNGYFIEGRKDSLYISPNGENYCLESIENNINLTYCNEFSLIISKENKIILILSYPDNTVYLKIDKDIKEIKSNVYLSKLINKIYITNLNIPKANGIKIKRRELLEEFYNNPQKFKDYNEIKNNNVSNKEANDEIVNRIIKVYKNHFSNDNINNNSNFYSDLGGDSLSYYMLLTSLEKEFNIKLTIERDIPLTPDDFAILIRENLNL